MCICSREFIHLNFILLAHCVHKYFLLKNYIIFFKEKSFSKLIFQI